MFRFDPSLATPDVRVDRTRAFLDMTSTGVFKEEKAVVRARFGKALDDSVFGPALTLDNDLPLEPFGADQVRRARAPSHPVPGRALAALAAGLLPVRLYVGVHGQEILRPGERAAEAALHGRRRERERRVRSGPSPRFLGAQGSLSSRWESWSCATTATRPG